MNNCKNCMNKGHLMKNCKYPITSYGILLKNKDKYLMVQRKYSLGFLEFFGGRYNEDDQDMLCVLIKQFTRREFNTLVCANNFLDIIKYFQFSESESEKYNKLSYNGYNMYQKIQNNGTLYKVISMLSSYKFSYDNEWSFPKGRKNNCMESNFVCALREFTEETGIYLEIPEISYTENSEISELYFGTNGKLYKHIYFVINSSISDLDLLSSFKESFEIKNIGFFTKEECIKNISLVIENERRVLFIEKYL